MCLLRCGIRIWFFSAQQGRCCPPGRSGNFGATRTDGRGRAKLLLLSANVGGAERAAQTNICIYGNMAGLGLCCSRSISAASGAAVLG